MTNEPFSLAGRTALVAGASRGIGLAIARAIAEAGARTLLGSRSLETLDRHASEMRQAGLQAEAVQLDISDGQSIETVSRELPALDVLVNVAGINLRKKFQDYTREEYDRILETNLHGIVHLTQRVGARMIERGQGGKIVNIGSILSVQGLPYVSVYGITKSALAGLTRTLASEWGAHDIQVNCIAPGFILTDLNRRMWQAEEMQAWMRAVQAMPRMGTVDDVAPLAVFLSGRGSNYITGQVIAVDGGYTTTAVWPFQP